MAPPAISAITMALATPSSSIDIFIDDSKMGAGAGFTAAAKRHHGLPPTPPNSLSPNMPAQAVRHSFSSPAPEHLDLSDIRAPESAAAVPLSKGALADLERQQVITPALLARDYLPKILLGHPEMPIRHIMACLTHDLRGFSRLDPPKARRMVVAALDSRHGGGPDGNVQFQKVAWGRWMAYVKGEKPPARAIHNTSRNRVSPAPSEASSFAASYSGSAYPIARSRRPSAYRMPALGQSYTGSDMPSLDEGLEDMSMDDHFVENMSIDGLDDISESDSSGEETDEEDWAGIGATALRMRNSVSTSAAPRRDYNMLFARDPIQRRGSSTRSTSVKPRIASSAPGNTFSSRLHFSTSKHNDTATPGAMDVDNTDAQEHDAARALLSLGSM